MMLVREVAEALSARLVGDGSLQIERIVHPADADKPSDLAIAMSAESFAALSTSQAVAAVVSAKLPAVPSRVKSVIIPEHERAALAQLTALFDGGPAHAAGIDKTAVIAPDAQIAAGVSIGPFVVIGPRTRIGSGTVVLPHVTIGADVTIGEQGLIYAGVRIGDRVSIGARAIIHYNAVVGSDGFSFLPIPSAPVPARVHSLGRIVIGDDVEIGAASTVARATLESTLIADGTKIDNHVHIAHNVKIGRSCLICGMAGISGSVTIGDGVVLGGGVGIADHVTIGAHAKVAAGSGVGTDVAPGVTVSGYPAIPHDKSIEMLLYARRQKALHERVGKLQTKVEALERSQRDEKGSLR
jgi:UDP-3-O-[3-hydroxymyristoyl] glucosamine N-acyltransferase